MIVVLNFPGDINACAKAASKSYGKDTDVMSGDEREEYVRRIWDKHTNISEHFVFSLDLIGVPRIVTFVMSFQRHGFSMTEFSQRRREPSEVTAEYLSRIESGESKEDARKCLPVTTPSDVTITLNREAARNLARIIRKYRGYDQFKDALETCRIDDVLAVHGWFTPDEEAPFCCPDFVDQVRAPQNEFEEVVTCPLYSATQLVRHRTLEVLQLAGRLSTLAQESTILFRSFHTQRMAQLRSLPQTQEPLRTIAQQLLK
jgi:hypothetical protein